jgi:hypothetical protein
VVESENRDSWEYFLRLLRRYILEVSSKLYVFILDYDKGLLEADVVLGERYIRAYYCKHLEGNFKSLYEAKGSFVELF